MPVAGQLGEEDHVAGVFGRLHRSPQSWRHPDWTSGRRMCIARSHGGVCLVSMGETKIRRTNINLDTELVDAAAAVLGTARTTDTVHAALRAVIDRAARERLAGRDFDDLTPDVLEQLRRPRQAV
jgi:Arc/MetJ family transcription regulator